MLLIVGIIVSSLPDVRRRIFEVFYFLHVIFAAGLVARAFVHTGKLVPILALLTWGADIFIRQIVMTRTLYPKKSFIETDQRYCNRSQLPKDHSVCVQPQPVCPIGYPRYLMAVASVFN